MNPLRATILVLVALLVSGCSVKDSDSGLTKVAKHTINAPMYAVLAVGAAGVMAGGGVGYLVSKTGDLVAGREWYQGEYFLGVIDQEKLDANISLAPFYEDNDFKLLKDSSGNDYLYFKDTGEFIRTKEVLNPKRWAVAGLEKRPVLKYYGFKLPDGITQEMIEQKAAKDRFGNIAYIGENSLLALRPRREGLPLSLHYEMFIITDGVKKYTNLGEFEPKTLKQWLQGNFPEQMKNSTHLEPVVY